MTFDAQSQLIRREEFEHLASLDAPDVVLLAHGWLTERRRAEEMVAYYRTQLAPIPVHGIYWPSRPGAAQGVPTVGLRNASYYRMKSRAGDVGTLGLAPWLTLLLRQKPALRLHLAGHSFGARLVTAAVSTLPPGAIQSLTLIQAAFSQFAFEPQGRFRNVVDPRRVTGPILITHTRRDHAVGFAYPIASRLAHQNASSLGDQSDPYGGLGRNGAAGAPMVSLTDLPQIRARIAAPVLNLEASAVIHGHTDVHHTAITDAIRAAVEAGDA